MNRLFVYGSLMKGELNAHLMAGARLVGSAQTVPAYRLVHLGGYPGMLSGGGSSVVGEVYEVPAATLAVLDAFEEHPEVFVRTPVRLQTQPAVAGADAEAACEAYLLRPEFAAGAAALEHGNWRQRHR